MAYELAPLPYDYAALEPFIDTETMHIHHDKHHQAYVNNTQCAAGQPSRAGRQADRRSGPRSGAGARRDSHRGEEQRRRPCQPHGFWKLMGAVGSDGVGGAPTGPIAAQIATDFGDFEAFKKLFNETTAKQFGSGWGWLVFTGGKLKVISTANQDSPLSQGLYPDPLQRHLGTRLLSEVPEPPPGLSGRVVECGQLARNQPALCRRQGIEARIGNRGAAWAAPFVFGVRLNDLIMRSSATEFHAGGGMR